MSEAIPAKSDEITTAWWQDRYNELLASVKAKDADLRKQIEGLRDEANRRAQMYGLEHRNAMAKEFNHGEYTAYNVVLALLPLTDKEPRE